MERWSGHLHQRQWSSENGKKEARRKGEDISQAWQNRAWSRDRPILWEYRLANLDNDTRASPMLVVRQGKWKLLMNPDRNRIELFDVVTDLGEYHNLASGDIS